MLIATGIMAIGLVMVATIFPVGVKLTSMSTERTIGAVVADEAFAKIQLYGLQANWRITVSSVACSDYQYIAKGIGLGGDDLWWTADDVNTGEFQYPSAVMASDEPGHYHWSALCRKVAGSDNEVQVTVFVTRKVAAASKYRAWDPNAFDVDLPSDWPKPVPVNVSFNPASPKQLLIVNGPGSLVLNDSRYFFDDGYTIVDNYSGRIYRVLEVKDAIGSDSLPDTLVLQQDWEDNGLTNETIWVVPPAVGSDRYPCVRVYQKVLRFDGLN